MEIGRLSRKKRKKTSETTPLTPPTADETMKTHAEIIQPPRAEIPILWENSPKDKKEKQYYRQRKT